MDYQFPDRLLRIAAEQWAELSLIQHPGESDSPLTPQLEALLRLLTEGSQGAAQYTEGDGAGLPALPGLSLVSTAQHTIHYLAVPHGPEEPPFVDAVLGMLQPAADQNLVSQLASVNSRCEIWVFMAEACPHCPKAVAAAISLSLANPNIVTSVIDAQHFSDLAKAFGARSVPLTVIDRQLSLPEVVPAAELVKWVVGRGGQEYQQKYYSSLIQSGRFAEAATVMQQEAGAVCFYRDWRESTTSTRIGLLLAVEQALQLDSLCLHPVVRQLLEVLQSEDVALRGDTVDLLGQIGDPSAQVAIRPLLQDANAEVAEVAAEVLHELQANTN